METPFDYLSKKFNDQLFKSISELFLGTENFSKLNNTADAWARKLPDDIRLHSTASLFDQALASAALSASSDRGESIPLPLDWHDTLLERWNQVRQRRGSGAAPFFLTSESVASQHLHQLSGALTDSCRTISEFFQRDTHQRLVRLELQNTLLMEKFDSLESRLALQGVEHAQYLPPSVNVTQVTTGQSVHATEFDVRITSIAEHNSSNPQYAIESLNQLRADSWNLLDSRGKFRLLANLGHAYEALGDPGMSASCFAEAYEHQKDDIDARALYCLSLFMRQQDAEAFEEAKQILAQQSTNELAAQILITTAPTGFDCLKLIGSEIQQSAGVIHALARMKHRSGDFPEALRLAKQAKDAAPDSSTLIETYLMIALEAARQSVFGILADQPDNDTVDTLTSVIKEGEALAESVHGTNKARIHFLVSRGYAFLDDEIHSQQHAHLAMQLDPSNIRFAIPYVGKLIESRKSSASINTIVNKYAPFDTDFELRGLFLSGLLLLNDESSHSLAGQYITEGMANSANNTTGSSLALAVAAIEHFHSSGQLQEQLPAIEKYLLPYLPSILRKAVQIHVKHANESADLEKAADELALLLESEELTAIPGLPRCLRVNADLLSLATIADALCMGNRYDAAFNLWKSVLDPASQSSQHDTVLRCGERGRQFSQVLAYFDSLRAHGNATPLHYQIAVSILDRFHCYNRLVPLCLELLGQDIADDIRYSINATLARLKRFVPELASFRFDAKTFPPAELCPPGNGMLVVTALVNDEQTLRALEFAYRLVRFHFDSPDAHKTIISFAFRSKANLKDILEIPDTVEVGVHVEFREVGSSHITGCFIEDIPASPMLTHEASPNDKRIQALMGLQVGDVAQFFDGVCQRELEVISITNRYAARIGDSLSKFQERFPTDDFLFAIPAANDNGIRQVLNIAESNRKQLHVLKTICKEYPVTPSLVSQYTGQDIISSCLFLMYDPELTFRCSPRIIRHTAQPRDESLFAGRMLVDQSVLGTIAWLDFPELLSLFEERPVVTWGTLVNLKVYLEHSSYLPFLLAETPGFSASEYRRRCERLIDALDRYCDPLDPVEALDALNHEIDVGQVFGPATAETVAVACKNKVALWSDDAMVAELSFDLGCHRVVGTERVLTFLQRQGQLSLYDVRMYKLALFSGGFDGLSIPFSYVTKTWRESGPSPHSRKMKQIFRGLQNPALPDDAILVFCVKLLASMQGAKLKGPRYTPPTFVLLEYLSRRPKGNLFIDKLSREYTRWFPGDRRFVSDLGLWRHCRLESAWRRRR